MPPIARDATADDNGKLLDLATACSSYGRFSQHVDRSPDFFSLCRLQGEPWSVGVVDGLGDSINGCVAIAAHRRYVNGVSTNTAYVTDLRVHPAHRGTSAADSLVRYAMKRCREFAGSDSTALCMVSPANKAMERLAFLHRFAEFITYSVFLINRHRNTSIKGLTGSPAEPEDFEEMASLWCKLAPRRQFAPEYNAESLALWIRETPGLSPSSYWLARRPDGTLAGFVGFWDQMSLKRTQVLRYTPSGRIFRAGFNTIAPLLGAAKLPPPGGVIRQLTVVHVCAPQDDPFVLRTLIGQASKELSGKGHTFFTVGFDARDPLSAALKGMLAVTTRTFAFVGTSKGRYLGPPLNDRPLYFEVGLM